MTTEELVAAHDNQIESILAAVQGLLTVAEKHDGQIGL